ncbi:hypothetical protein SADUNF_Sadunf10G0173500 [Salix dunnii]|uniref:START domain-containing protein n=1 Tax=Salix dunnii TaxID=1413687 RepID=A0A835JUP7_9ROSI|nr:hypothetical protein SADUNF_Sadunf10G0173500 [Salix dunnii]
MARSTAMKAAGLVLALLIFAFLSLAASSSNNQIHILNAERRIDLSSHIVKIFLTLKVENVGTSPASEILLAFPPSQADQLALVKAQAAIGKKKKKIHVHLDVNPTQLPDAPSGTKYFSISLLNTLSSGETATLEVLYILTHSLEPFPAEISQLESQLVYFRDSALILSPYHIKRQTTFIMTPSTKVESFTRVEPTKFAGRELKYGPYEDRPPYSFSPVIVHLENNSPFAVVEELLREVEISHWGNLQITEHYKLVHAGARHKGVFSRVDYQSRASVKGVSSFKHLLASLPPRVHSVYYRDEIGNISSSHLRTDYRKSELEIEPRYPLFGGWKATFVIGYGLPLEDFLFESPDGKRYLNFSFGCPLAQTVVNKLTIKVVLPEGSKDPSAAVPYPVEQRLETKYSYLDVVGRTVLVLEKKNVVPEHITPFQVYYSFKPIFMLAEPLMLASVYFLFFMACVAYLQIDLSIRKVSTFLCVLLKWVFLKMMAKWKGGYISLGPTGLVDSFYAKGISFFEKTTSNASKQDPFLRKRSHFRSANIDSYIRITDNGRESIKRKVFFIFTLYNTLKDNDQLKLGANSSEDAGKWIPSLQTAMVKECPYPEKEFMSFSKNWPPSRFGSSKRADSKRSVGYYPFLQNEAVTSDVIAPSTWKIFGCQNGLRLFKEAKDWGSRWRHWDDHPAIMAVGVVNGTSEAIFRALLSLGASRSEGSVVEHLDGHTDIIHKKLCSNWLAWGMSRRDLLLRRYWRKEEDGTYVILYHSVIHKECPPQKGYVRACLKSGGYVITPVNQGRESLVKHMLAIDWKFWKVYLRPPYARSITIRMLERIAALRELFRAKAGNYSSDFSSSDSLLKTMLPQAEMEAIETENKSQHKFEQNADLKENEVEKINSGRRSLMSLNDASDEFFDFPDFNEDIDFDLSDNGWFPEKSQEQPASHICPHRLSSPAVFVKKLHDLAVHKKGYMDFQEFTREENVATPYGKTLQKESAYSLPCSWATGEPSTFLIRGENYLKDNQKIKAEGSLMQMVGADWLRSDHREDDLGSRPGSIIQKYAAQGRPEFFFVINIQFPGATQYTLALYYILKTPLEETPLLHSFVHGDDAFRNSRFKLIPYISKGSWVVKQSVGKKACLVGQALEMHCFRGKNYLELDIDVGSSTVARGVASLVLGYLNNLVIEMAFVIQGNNEEELPEILLGTCRLNHLDVSKAVLV